ncbi:MAG: LysM peptidoglycan-binding domain-containing protein [Pseudomonadota bacterium]
MAHTSYAVRSGDTLGAIASQLGLTVQDLLEINPQIDNPNLIHVGDTILVPAGGTLPGIHARTATAADPSDLPLWYKIARREVGVAEIPGASHAPRVLEYLATCERLPLNMRGRDETAWCSAFVNWCVEQAGLAGTNSAWARSWLDEGWGTAEDSDAPRVGAIAVFRRFNAGTDGGHVAFFERDLGTKIEILGGNQSNKVKTSTYPKNGRLGSFNYELLGYRWGP